MALTVLQRHGAIITPEARRNLNLENLIVE
jgi:hypothetical protein